MSKASKSQVIMKSDTTENWKKCEDKYIPVENTIIVYQDLNLPPKFKISDGIHKLKDLQFVNYSNNSNQETKPSVDGAVLRFK